MDSSNTIISEIFNANPYIKQDTFTSIFCGAFLMDRLWSLSGEMLLVSNNPLTLLLPEFLSERNTQLLHDGVCHGRLALLVHLYSAHALKKYVDRNFIEDIK